jgi:enoyl-CoA hydratase
MPSQVPPPVILVERRGRVAIVTLNRPEKLNALSTQLAIELEAALQALETDDAIAAIVLTGAGERAFSSGGDMKERRDELVAGTIRDRKSVTTPVRACRKPTLAAIRGFAYGGGALLAMTCDIRIAAEDAKFMFPSASHGHASGGSLLPRIVGVAKAKELLFTCDVVNAREALRIGLVNHVVPVDQVLDYTVAMAERIAGNSAPAVRAIKDAIELALPDDRAREYEARVNPDIRASDESAARFHPAAERVVGRH